LALLFCYAGIALVFWHDMKINKEEGIVLGSLLVLASSISYAVYMVGSGTLVHKMGSIRYTAYASIVSCVAVILHFLAARDVGELVQPMPVIGLGITMAVFSTVLPVLLMSEGIRRIGSARASMIGTVGPVLTIGMGYFFLNEPITLPQVAGAILVLAGVAVISLRK
jgi:drug/metabolite transporter (DMT)-like permease